MYTISLDLPDSAATEKTKIGCSFRRRRLLDTLAFIDFNHGATDLEIEAFLVLSFGMKHDTAAAYRDKLHLEQLIIKDRSKWRTTRKHHEKRIYTKLDSEIMHPENDLPYGVSMYAVRELMKRRRT